MIELNPRESFLIKSIKFHSFYRERYVEFNNEFEEYYKRFEGTFLFSRKKILYSMFCISPEKEINKVEEDFIKIGKKILFDNDIVFKEEGIEELCSFLTMWPVGIIEDGKYIKKIKFYGEK